MWRKTDAQVKSHLALCPVSGWSCRARAWGMGGVWGHPFFICFFNTYFIYSHIVYMNWLIKLITFTCTDQSDQRQKSKPTRQWTTETYQRDAWRTIRRAPRLETGCGRSWDWNPGSAGCADYGGWNHACCGCGWTPSTARWEVVTTVVGKRVPASARLPPPARCYLWHYLRKHWWKSWSRLTRFLWFRAGRLCARAFCQRSLEH